MQIERMSTLDTPLRLRTAAGRKWTNCRPPAPPGNRHFQSKSVLLEESSVRRSLKKHLLDETLQKPGSATTTPHNAAPVNQKWALFAHADRTDHILMSIGLFAAFVSGSSLPVINIVFANAVTALSNKNFPPHNVDMDSIVSIFWQLVGIAGWILVSEFLCIALLTHSAARQTRVMREAVMEALVYQELGWFDTNNPYSLSSDIGSTMVVIQDGLGRKLGQFVKHTTQVVMAMSVGIMRGWNVGLLIAATLPVFLISIVVFVNSVAKSTNMETDEYSNAAAVAEEALTSVSTVMAFNAQDSVLKRFKTFLYSGEDVYLKLSRVIAVAVAVIQFLSFVLYGYGLWIGGLIVASNDAVVPSMAKALPAIFVEITGLLAIGMAAPAMESLAASRAAANYIIEIEKQRSAIDCRSDDGIRLDDRGLEGSITFKEVVFSYPTRPKDMVLKTCSFTIAPGNRIALVGPSGSGKSTVISLLARLYDPAFGSISIDGHKIETMQLRWLRAQFGVVRQEPVLFAASVMDNVRYGRANATDEEVEEACRLAHAHEFIRSLPDGYATQIGANGGILSAGQRQRLAIARAVVRKPRILLLDEATVALDPKSGDLVQRAFDELIEREAVTTLVIAHRLSTLKQADLVFVMEDGRISEQGHFSQLASDPDSRYCALFGGAAVDGDTDENMQTRLTQIALLESSRYRGPTRRQDRYGVERDSTAPAGNGLLGSFYHATAYTSSRPSHQVDSSRRRGPMAALKSPAILQNPYASSDARASDIALLESFASSRGFADTMKSVDHGRLSTVKSGSDGGRSHSPEFQVIPVAMPVPDTPNDVDPTKSVFQKIVALAAEDRRYMIIAMMTCLFNGIASPVIVVLRADMIQDLYRIEALDDDPQLRQAANKYFMMFLAVGFGIAISSYLQSLNFRLLGRNLTNRMRSLAFRSMLRQDMKWFDKPAHSAGALSGMLANDTAAVKIIAGEIQGRKTQNLIVIAVGFILSCVIGSWLVALVFFGIVVVIVITIVIDQRITWYAEEQGDRTLASAGRIANEIIHNVQTITENNLQETILAEFRASLDLPTRVAIRSGYSSGLAIAFSQAVKWVGYGVLDYAGAVFIQNGTTNFKLFYRSFNLANASAMCIDETALFVSDEKSATIAAERTFALMENKPDVDIDDPNGRRPDTHTGGLDVRVDSAEFSYPTAPASLVLKNMTLRARGGQTTAMMGSSDGGKSTLLQLLIRLYDVDGGTIFVDGIPIQQLDVRWLRANIALVPQDPVLFRLSVLDNIRLGRPDASRDDVVRVCERTDAHAFICELPSAYDTIVDSDKFSRGQKQRIAIARALLLEPRVLLLDEATSALDQDSQARVAASLQQLAASGQCTVLAVTQQESIVRDAAQVLVASNGAILDEDAARATQAARRPQSFFHASRVSASTGPTNRFSSMAGSSKHWI